MKIKTLSALVLITASLTAWAEAPVYDVNQDTVSQPTIALEEPTSPQKFVEGKPGLVSAETNDESTDNEKTDMVSQMQSLQKEMQALRGMLEVQKHDLKVLQTQQNALYKDLDTRISKTATPSTPAPAIAATLKPAGYVASENNPDAKKDKDGTNDYQLAFALVRDKKYPEAATAMEAFLQNYPNSQYAPNAHYWLGELYLAQGFIEKGMDQFNRVIRQYPNSNKAAGAMLKLGYAYYDKGNWLQARAKFSQVKNTFPDSSEARLAKGRIRDMDRQGL